ncbi:MAG TPA: nuclear transport factor 2 family protein [Dehalococcoidia bacterium]|nr:nuclear transport factor 2 family protein [Dehalococcoidia bacterium]
MTDAASLLTSLDPQVDTAMALGDGAALDTLLAPDFIYTHSNNNHQVKPEFIAAIVKRENRPRRDLTEVEAEVHGDIAVTRGNLDVVYYDERPTLYFRYVRIWRLEGDTWRAISHRTVYAKDRDPASG